MSGGTFDYNQRRIREIANRVEHEIAMNDQPEEIIAEFKKGYEMLRKAEIYAQRIDRLLAGDDGEETFLEHLEDELDILSFELSVKAFEKDEDFED